MPVTPEKDWFRNMQQFPSPSGRWRLIWPTPEPWLVMVKGFLTVAKVLVKFAKVTPAAAIFNWPTALEYKPVDVEEENPKDGAATDPSAMRNKPELKMFKEVSEPVKDPPDNCKYLASASTRLNETDVKINSFLLKISNNSIGSG